MKGELLQGSHCDGLLQCVIARKELHCYIHWEVAEILAGCILREGVAGLSRTWCVWCGCDVVCTLTRA